MNPYILKLVRKNLIVFGITFLGLLLVEYVVFGLYFRKHFYANTWINGVDCSNLTAEEADKIIHQEISVYKLTIKGKDNLVQQISGDSIDLSYQCQHQTEELLKNQNAFAWIAKAFKEHPIDNTCEVVYSEDKLKACLNEIGIPEKGKAIATQNARISTFNAKTGFSILNEVVGNELDRGLLNQVVERSIHTLSRECSLEKEGCYIAPTVISSSPVLKKALETINSYMKTKLTYQFGTHTEVLDQKQIGPAIVVDANNQVSIDEQKIKQFVTYLANTYNNPDGSWKFQTSYKKQVVIKGGSFGWILDENQEIKEIIECIKAGQQIDKKPVPASNSVNKEYRTIGNTYVEINKAKQHMFFYKQGKLILESDVVTGILRGGHDTPAGLYYISQKQQNRTLRGFNDDGSKYAAFVRYWMRFNGGIGLHDAPWQAYFGGERYLYAGSHGCVNLPSKVARQLYQVVDLYTPVIVY